VRPVIACSVSAANAASPWASAAAASWIAAANSDRALATGFCPELVSSVADTPGTDSGVPATSGTVSCSRRVLAGELGKEGAEFLPTPRTFGGDGGAEEGKEVSFRWGRARGVKGGWRRSPGRACSASVLPSRHDRFLVSCRGSSLVLPAVGFLVLSLGGNRGDGLAGLLYPVRFGCANGTAGLLCCFWW
jgi:hypothetical protein